MPTCMIGTCNEDDPVDVMMAWGGICAGDMAALDPKARKTFTLAESDYLDIDSASKAADKFARAGLLKQ